MFSYALSILALLYSCCPLPLPLPLLLPFALFVASLHLLFALALAALCRFCCLFTLAALCLLPRYYSFPIPEVLEDFLGHVLS
jgi:hypothetical protein